MLNLLLQRTAIKPYLNMQFLFVLAALDDYRKIDYLVYKEGLDLNVAIGKAIRDHNDVVLTNLKKYKKMHDLLEAVKADDKDQVQILLAEGVDKTMALLLTTFREDNSTAIKFINMDAFTPAQTTQVPLLMKQLVENKVLWQALINHRNEEIKSQWLLLEAAFKDLPYKETSPDTDPEFLLGMQILGLLPAELQMEIVGMNNPDWLDKGKGYRQVTHLYKAATVPKPVSSSSSDLSMDQLTQALRRLDVH